MEIFSPPRLTPHSPAAGVEDAGAWDFTSGWDASDPTAVCELWSHLEMTKPAWIIMSPPCDRLSKLLTWTHPNSCRDMDRFDSEIKMAIGLIGLCLEVAAFQIEGGRHFVFESSSNSSSWKLPEMISFVISCLPFLENASACSFGNNDLESHMFYGKKWQFMTNAEEMVQELDREAYGHWWHPQPLIMAMLRGMQRFAEGECVRADFCDAVATHAVDDDAETEPTHDDFFHRRQQTIDEALWRLHVNLGHASLATMLRHLKHAGE